MRVFGMNLGIRVLLIAAAVGLAGAGMARGAGPAAGGVIHVATNAEPGTLDWTASTATATRLVAWHVYETLFASTGTTTSNLSWRKATRSAPTASTTRSGCAGGSPSTPASR